MQVTITFDAINDREAAERFIRAVFDADDQPPQPGTRRNTRSSRSQPEFTAAEATAAAATLAAEAAQAPAAAAPVEEKPQVQQQPAGAAFPNGMSRDDAVSYIRPRAVKWGAPWVQANVTDPNGGKRLSDLDDAALAKVLALVQAKEAEDSL